MPKEIACKLFVLMGSLSIGFFLFPWDFLNPFSVDWVWGSGDFEQHFIGWQFFLREPLFQFPLAKLNLYGDGIAKSIIFTDSIPIIAIPLKIFAGQVKAEFQYFGLFVLSSLVLQALLSYSYFRLSGVTAIVSSSLALVVCVAPPLLFRATCHTSLTAQWMLIAALILCKLKKQAWRRWLLLLSIALWVHLYLFTMCLLLFLSHLNLRNLQSRNCQLWTITILGLLLLQSYVLGYIPRISSDATSSGYGIFTFNLLSPISSASNFSLILPGFELPYGSHEGFSFLGPVFLVALVLVGLSSRPRKILIDSIFVMDKKLLLAIILMALFAVSPVVSIGFHKIDLGRLPYPLFIVGDTFRASGRFIWPLYYYLMLESLSAVALAYVPKEMSPRFIQGFWTLVILSTTIFASLGDLYGYSSSRRIQFTAQQDTTKSPVENIRASILKESGRLPRSYVFYPNLEAPHGFNVFARLALLSSSSTNGTYLARYDKSLITMQNNDTKEALLGKRLDPEAIYVLGDLELNEEQSLPPLCMPDLVAGLGTHCLLEVEGFRLLTPTLNR